MRIAVFSDTHNRYPPLLPKRFKDADEIWHLGDVCEPETLAAFEELQIPLRVVMGNCDSHPWPTSLDLKRGGLRFFLTHIPPAKFPRGVAAVLHGHTHVPRDEMIDNVRWLNPGCITRPNRGAPSSFAWLTVSAGAFTWELQPLHAD
jgi:putative phosphoesterase